METTPRLTIRGRLSPHDIPKLSERVRSLLATSDAERIVCDVRGVIDPDAVAIEVLARLQLTARRLGREICLSYACDELKELLRLSGLEDVVRVRR